MAAASTADHILKRGEVSAMLKLGFLPSPTRSPPPLFSPSPTFHHPPPSPLLHHHHHHHRTNSPKRPPPPLPPTTPQRRSRLHDRLSSLLLLSSYPSSGQPDVDLSVSSPDGFRVSLPVHRHVLALKSSFFSQKLPTPSRRHLVDISECDDVEAYAEAVALMYSSHPRSALSGEPVPKVLSLLKVSVALAFEEGVEACLEHLEAIPWTEAEEERVIEALAQVRVHRPVSGVLGRVSEEPPCGPPQAAGIVSRLLGGVLQASDKKARREMKAFVSRLVGGEGVCGNAQEKETLYDLCRRCLNSLHLCLSDVKEGHRGDIALEADNLQWVVGILIGRRMGEEFVGMWADQKELARMHTGVPCVYRYEISKVTVQLCVAIGRGQVLVSKEGRLDLLRTWLEALYDDFAWIKRTCKSVDRRVVEDGLGQTILTLPMPQQRDILLDWFERFLSQGDDCPNIQWAFEVWWRRVFCKQHDGRNREDSNFQIAACGYAPTH